MRTLSSNQPDAGHIALEASCRRVQAIILLAIIAPALACIAVLAAATGLPQSALAHPHPADFLLVIVVAVLASAALLWRAWRSLVGALRHLVQACPVPGQRDAGHDTITGLPDRRALLGRLDVLLAAPQARGAVLLIDLDRFRVLNDTQGYDRGDLLLHRIAQCIRIRLGPADMATRVVGDQFMVLACGLPSHGGGGVRAAADLAERLRRSLSSSFELDGVRYACTASIGVAMFGQPGCPRAAGADELARQASAAMVQAKAAGRNTVRFFDPGMQSAEAARQALESDLRQAVAGGHFALHYQGQFDDQERINGAEVLVRWTHPTRGVVSPAMFIPLCEATGLILPLGHWVLETACAQLAAWSAQPAAAMLTLSVNVSARQFNQPRFVDEVIGILQRTGADPRRLKLELTEGSLLENTEAVIATIEALKQAGVGVALDDFGTGYSSLAYLKRLPLDQLKIDQTFVRDLMTDPNDVAIVRAIIALGQSLGIDVIAEGVETAEQRALLAAAGCRRFQGYLLARPMPVAQFEDALSNLWRN